MLLCGPQSWFKKCAPQEIPIGHGSLVKFPNQTYGSQGLMSVKFWVIIDQMALEEKIMTQGCHKNGWWSTTVGGPSTNYPVEPLKDHKYSPHDSMCLLLTMFSCMHRAYVRPISDWQTGNRNIYI